MQAEQPSNLAEALPLEQSRVRDLLEVYESLGSTGAFGATQLRAALDEAEQASASGDVVRMIRAYAALKGCE
ncbi:MAG: hypothetical protein GC161_18295 [Planctomycetaceae bacterium]|nr:hypothetical protein [Planctomycetaceae bacterium]